MADFARFAAAGYGPHLLPIVPHDARISEYGWIPEEKERARRIEQLTKTRGKVPGKLLRDGGWVGFANFTEFNADPAALAQWSAWPGAGVGLQAKRFPALDIDVEDIDYVAALLRRVEGLAGFIFGRVGRRPRILLPFQADEPLSKRRLPLPSLGEGAAVELLGAGQQYVIDGIHPKTGQPYSWGRRGFPEADRLPALTADLADRIFAAAAEIAGVNALPAPATFDRTLKVQAPVSAPGFQAVADAVRSIPNDLVYDTWISIGHAIKAVTDGAPEGFDLWVEWSLAHPDTSADACAYKWSSFHPPYHAGWDTIRALMPAAAQSEVAAFDFTAIEQPPSPIDAMFARYIWVERLKVAFDRNSGDLLDNVQFAVRHNVIARPSSKENAWALWTGDAQRLERVASATYRPGMDMIVHEKAGACVNTWHGPDWTPTVVTDEDAQPWIEHMAYLVPDDSERNILLDWLAFVVQQPAQKPNFQIVWGSRHHGVGKDLALEPVRHALGAHNVRNVQPEQIVDDYTDWFENARLIVVEDMQAYGKRSIESRLRPLMAAPPDYVSIRKKFMPVYDAPNLAALIFLTNERNALPISKEDRRYFVTWCGDEIWPKAESYYAGIVDWYAQGGREIAASWLMQRDISKFNHKGRAPMTDAKIEMIGASLSPLESWIEDGIRDGDGPFKPDIIEANELMRHVPKTFRWDSATPTRFGEHLLRAGAQRSYRGRLGQRIHTTETDRGQLFILRRHNMYRNLPHEKLIELFWKQRAAAQQEELKGEFDVGQNNSGPLL